MRSVWFPVFQARLNHCARVSWDKMGKDNNHKVQGYCWPNPEQSLISGVAPAPGTVDIYKASAVASPEMQDTLLLLLGAKR